jgi:hypothetical protein
VQSLLEQALAPAGDEGDPLFLAAMAVEADERVSAEMTEWDDTIADGVEGETSRRNAGEPARRAGRRRAAGRGPRVAPRHGTLLTRRPP